MRAFTARPERTPSRPPTPSSSATRSSSPTADRASRPRPRRPSCTGLNPGTGSSTSSRRWNPATPPRSHSCDGSGLSGRGGIGTARTARSSSSSSGSAAASERALDVPLGVAFGDVPALVAYLLAARDRQLDLRAAVLEVELRRDDGQPLFLHLADQRIELAPVHEQLAVAIGIVVGEVPLRVFGDVRADEPELAVADVSECALQRCLAVPERLHLRTGQHEPSLEPVEQVVVVPRTAILGDRLLACHPASVPRVRRGAGAWYWNPGRDQGGEAVRGGRVVPRGQRYERRTEPSRPAQARPSPRCDGSLARAPRSGRRA